MNINKHNFSSIEKIQNQYSIGNKPNVRNNANISFNEILSNQVNKNKELKFSKHANERLASRNITLSDNQIKRLESGIEKAQQKGIKESLVLLDNIAFVINIKNQTVITAVGENETEDKIFTNIDGAVII